MDVTCDVDRSSLNLASVWSKIREVSIDNREVHRDRSSFTGRAKSLQNGKKDQEEMVQERLKASSILISIDSSTSVYF